MTEPVFVAESARLLIAAGTGIILLLLLIIKFKIHPILSLLISALVIGLGAGMPVPTLVSTVEKGAGDTLQGIVLLIGLGSLFGGILEVSGGAQCVAQTLINKFGEKKSGIALGITGLVVGTTVFFEAGVVILIPLAFGLAKKTKKSTLYYVIPLLAGLATGFAFIPPSAGSVLVANMLNVDLGIMIAVGVPVGILSLIFAGILWSKFIGSKIDAGLPSNIQEVREAEEGNLPKFSTVLCIILVPLVLILCNTLSTYIPGIAPARPVLEFLGTPFVALIIAVLCAMYFLGKKQGYDGEQLKQMETAGQVSLRGLRKDATLFNEIVIDVNTMYFERNGGYEYAKQFYEEAYHFIEEKFGADNVISAVMHADEINVAASEELGKEVYHYHLHAMVLPVVEKEILWSKRCKDEKLRGTVKEVVNQISHSKKWKSDIPMTDEKGNPLLRKNGKPMFRASYSILQDELFHYMTEQGFKGFQRGEYGSTAEHLTSLQYQIQQDKERLEKLQKRIQKEQVKYEPARHISKTLNEIDSMGQKTFTGKMAISQKDYSELTALAKEGITSRAEIKKFEQSANFYRQKYMDSANALERMKTKYNELKEKCRPFLEALEHFPEVAKLFTEKVKQLFSFKEAQERAEKEAREKERQERIKARKSKRGMER